MEMPKYQCHKQVWALKIKKIKGTELVVDEPHFAPIPVGQSWIDKHNPEPGGYYVVYQDGYASYSPAGAFESGYTSMDGIPESEQEIEKEIQDKNLNAPRLTPDAIQKIMDGVKYHTYIVPDTTTTIAVATTESGFTLAVEYSACASPENFDAAIGEKIALQNAHEAARKKLWELEGYALKKSL